MPRDYKKSDTHNIEQEVDQLKDSMSVLLRRSHYGVVQTAISQMLMEAASHSAGLAYVRECTEKQVMPTKEEMFERIKKENQRILDYVKECKETYEKFIYGFIEDIIAGKVPSAGSGPDVHEYEVKPFSEMPQEMKEEMKKGMLEGQLDVIFSDEVRADMKKHGVNPEDVIAALRKQLGAFHS